MAKRVLLTGIGGSIGVHTFAHIMTNTDWEVVGVVTFRHKGLGDRLIEITREHPEWLDRLQLVVHDLATPISILTKKKIGYVDYIINLASLSDVGASIEHAAEFVMNNVSSTINLLEYARDLWGLVETNKKPLSGTAFLHFSTDEVYGPTSNMNESHEEWSPHLPSNPYAASKAMQEDACIAWWRTFNIPLIITNTMNNFGEMQQPFKFPVIVQKAAGSGELIELHGFDNGDGTAGTGSRSYIHSRNASDALLFILKNSPYLHQSGAVDKPDRYNIVGDKQISNEDFAKLIAKLMDKKLDYRIVDFHSLRPGHDRHYGLNGKKLSEMGWKSPVSFEESMKNTIEWQTRHPEWIQKTVL